VLLASFVFSPCAFDFRRGVVIFLFKVNVMGSVSLSPCREKSETVVWL